jgi:hypothetical protein
VRIPVALGSPSFFFFDFDFMCWARPICFSLVRVVLRRQLRAWLVGGQIDERVSWSALYRAECTPLIEFSLPALYWTGRRGSR